MTDYLLIAVTNHTVLSEATHAAAASGLEVVACEDPREIARHALDATAIAVDATTAAHVGACHAAAPVFFLAPDPGPVDFEAALRCHAASAFIVPAESPEFLGALGEAVRDHREGLPGAGTVARSSRKRAGPGRSHHCAVVLGTAGGVGASTFAVALAGRASMAAESAVLIDAAPEQGGLDLVMGLEETAGLRWPELSLGAADAPNESAVDIDGSAIRSVLPANSRGVAVLSGSRSTVADPFRLSQRHLDAVVGGLRGLCPVVIDGPPLEWIHRAYGHVVVITAAEIRAVAAATRLVRELEERGMPQSLVLRHRGWSSLTVAEVEQLVGIDVVAELPTVRRLARTVEETGVPHPLPRALSTAADLVLSSMGWETR